MSLEIRYFHLKNYVERLLKARAFLNDGDANGKSK